MSSLWRRYLHPCIQEDLGTRMVFIGGPRQVGKTTLARMIGDDHRGATYLNWDSRPHRRRILEEQWEPEADLLVLDELHKYPRWKTLIKGIWDTRLPGRRVMVTGSARLDTYRRDGDSLLGRYRYYRLHPLTLRELSADVPGAPPFSEGPPELVIPGPADGLSELLQYGGFPEPFGAANTRALRRWHRERFERVFREDIRESEIVRSLAQVELLGELLPSRVTSPLSYRSLSEDVEASPKTIKSWIELLERNYFLFRVPPYHRRLERALKKESKYYLWDWSAATDDGARFENMMASHLLKYCHAHQDAHGTRVELFYLRDLEKREVDFLVTWEGEPWFAVETRLSGGGGLKPLRYFADRLGVTGRYLVTGDDALDYEDRLTGVRVVPASRFLMALI